MQDYIKIYNIFNRDENGSMKLIEGDFASDTVKSLQNIQWLWTEKINGVDISVHWNGHKVEFVSRTVKISPNLQNYLVKTFCNNEVDEMFEQKFGRSDTILFGVCYSEDSYVSDINFILFDVIKDGVWLLQHEIAYVAHCFNIISVPVVNIGTLVDAVSYIKTKPLSKISDAFMEGLICKPQMELFDRLGNRIIVKIKAKDFYNV